MTAYKPKVDDIVDVKKSKNLNYDPPMDLFGAEVKHICDEGEGVVVKYYDDIYNVSPSQCKKSKGKAA